MSSAKPFNAALDPACSAVVEACAGSGKTWLLAARIVRLLLAGAAPAEILAITFTRKAAREIEERVVDWLRVLATAADAEAAAFLAERGAATDAATLARARGLYERVTGAQPGLAVNTFHGWFLQLVAVAPLSANLAGTTLADDGSRRFDELWQSFAKRLQRASESAAAAAFVRLLDGIGLASTRTLLRNGMARRAEWLARIGADGGDPGSGSGGDCGDSGIDSGIDNSIDSGSDEVGGAGSGRDGDGRDGLDGFGSLDGTTAPVAAVLADLQSLFGVGAAGDALAKFFAAAGDERIRGCADILAAGNKTETDTGQALLAALALPLGDSRFDALRAALLTRDGGLRQKLAETSAAMVKRLGDGPAATLVATYRELVERLQDAVAQQQEEKNLAFNRDALIVHHAFLAHLEAFKAERRQIDFVDAEWRVLQLLTDEACAAFVQARLDARYRHVLLDEFQDTNPLQWQILLAWLAAYSDAARPSVFLVGDPKQSIYRFRRAEPRLFATAANFLARQFAAVRLTQDATRRNAPAIVAVVNSLFAAEPAFQPFRPQQSLAAGLPGRVELLPLVGDEADGEENREAAGDAAAGAPATSAAELAESPVALRDPLHVPATETTDAAGRRRRREAAAIAARLAAMVGRTLVRERAAAGEGGAGGERPLRYGDILLLARTRSHLAIYEQALAAAGIPYTAASRGGLLDSLEVRDLVALLEFLVTPAADLALAHALKSPVFACSDDDLLALAARGEAGWRARLAAAAATGGSPRLVRAAALIERWLAAAARLPAHDLLDRIYHEGEVPARYRLAVPESRRAAALANLEALLLLALDLDGGRYPSLPRFIDELKALRRAEGDDAPDEGELAADEALAADGRVRILTVHGAKGLEAPLVWLIDANASPPADKAWDVLVDWQPEAPAPRHFSFVGRKDERGRARAALFDAEEAAAAREELNLLYVAVTRAKQLFFASGIAGSRGGDGASAASSTTAYARLQSALARLVGAAEEGGEAVPARAYGETLPIAAGADAVGAARVGSLADGEGAGKDPGTESAEGAGHETSNITLPISLPPLPRVGERRTPPDAAARFGILLHALLERRTEQCAEMRDQPGWWRALGYSDGDVARARPVAERLLAAPALQRFFDPARYLRAWNEMELTDEAGAVCRLDRLVEDAEAFWVLDYKSSAAANTDPARLADYRAQVAGYCRAIAAIFVSKPVRGALVFADASVLEVTG